MSGGVIRPDFAASFVISDATKVTIPEGVYSLSPKHAAGMRLDVDGGSKSDGGNIQIYEDNGTKAQQFRISASSSGYQKLVCENSGMAVDVTNGAADSGRDIYVTFFCCIF